MGRFLETFVLLVRRVAWMHRLVQAPGPGVTVVFLTFMVLGVHKKKRRRDLRFFPPSTYTFWSIEPLICWYMCVFRMHSGHHHQKRFNLFSNNGNVMPRGIVTSGISGPQGNEHTPENHCGKVATRVSTCLFFAASLHRPLLGSLALGHPL
jgi:hypothetical protein